MFDGAPQRREGLLVAEVARPQAAIHAEEQIGAAFVVTERFDEELVTVLGNAEVRRRAPRVDARNRELP